MKTIENWSIQILTVGGITNSTPILFGEIDGESVNCGAFLGKEGNMIYSDAGTFILGKESLDQSIAQVMEGLEE